MERDNKRAQLTLFIVLAIVIVGSIGVYFAISSGVFDSSSSAAKKFPEVNSLVEECLEEVTLDGIYFNSLQGGYYNVSSEDTLTRGFFELPIYFDDGKKLPEMSVLEDELNKYIEDNLNFCLLLNDLEARDYELSFGDNLDVKSNIKGTIVEIVLNQIVTVSREDESIQFKRFSKNVNFDYLSKYNALKDFLEVQAEEPLWIPFTQTQELGKEYGFSFEINPLSSEGDKTNYIYRFKYLNIEKHKNLDYFFVFGVRYNV